MQCLYILLTPESVQYCVGFFSTLPLFHRTVQAEYSSFESYKFQYTILQNSNFWAAASEGVGNPAALRISIQKQIKYLVKTAVSPSWLFYRRLKNSFTLFSIQRKTATLTLVQPPGYVEFVRRDLVMFWGYKIRVKWAHSQLSRWSGAFVREQLKFAEKSAMRLNLKVCPY